MKVPEPPIIPQGLPCPRDKALIFLLLLLFASGFGLHHFYIGRKDKAMPYVYLLIATAVITVISVVTCGVGSVLYIIPAIWVTIYWILDIISFVQGTLLDSEGYTVKL